MTAARAAVPVPAAPPAPADRQCAVRQALEAPPWCWPIDVTRYDRAPELTADERAALAALADDVRWWQRARHRGRPERATVARLRRPLADACAALEGHTPRQRECAAAAVAAVLLRCAVEGRSYWGWSPTTWVEVLGTSQQAFLAAHPAWVDRQVRHDLIGLAYLLRCVTDLRPLGHFKRPPLAAKVFGQARVDAALAALDGVLRAWGYREPRDGPALPRVVCEALLANASPRLSDLSAAGLDALRLGAPPDTRALLYQLQRGLAALGLMAPPADPAPAPAPVEGVDPLWEGWVRRWEGTSTLARATRRHIRGCLLKAGRWLATAQPSVREPAHWTRELCAAYVAAVDRMRSGDFAQRRGGLHERLGRPLSAHSKEAYLGALRQFFRECQEWGWIPGRFDPARALATPRSVKALIGPNPRVLADDVWAKLLWAGLHLEPADLQPLHAGGHFYPVELVRALAVTWLFSGLRSDEIARLRVGCVRWQRDGATAPERGPAASADGAAAAAAVLPHEAVCLLDVPAHKTGIPFTKPVDPLLGRAIAAWEAVRPTQPALLDPRTGEAVAFLSCYRAKRVAKTYLNKTLIPTLCRKAGVPLEDARGRITSHRARSTIASQLSNAKEPMTLFELQAWLGHRSPASTQHYARLTPTTLAKADADADYFARNVRTVRVLLDREAVQTGAAAGAPWQYFDLGPGYCTYSFFEQCPHRMACARCDFYVPKDSTKAQLLEAKDHLQRLLAANPLTDDERAAVEDGSAAVDRLLDRLVDVPTPAGPTPRELASAPRGKLPPVLRPTSSSPSNQQHQQGA